MHVPHTLPTFAVDTAGGELPAAGPPGPTQRHGLSAPRLTTSVAIGLLAATATLVLLWAVTARPAAAQSGAGIDIIDFGFDAATTTVPAGTTITFTNTGERPHTATDRGGTFDTQSINPGETAAITLDTPGTYAIFCRINPSKMNATIVVQPSPNATSARIQALDPTNLEGETLRFDPPQLEVKAGSTLVFANVGGKPHSLTAFDGTFNSGILQPGPEGGRFAGSNTTIRLDKPGTYEFFCEIHPQVMKGTLTVTGSPPATVATTATTAVAQPSTTGTIATAPPKRAEVAIADFSFTQADLSVAPGAELTFRNTGQAPHTATFDDVELDTGTLDSGGVGTLTAPTAAGSYSYFCAIHPRMRGTLVVLSPGVADPAAGPVTTIAPGSTGAGTGGTGQGATTTTGAAGAATTAAPAVAPAAEQAAASGGSSGGTKLWVIITIAAACLLGGIGLAPFLSRRRNSG